MKKNYLTLILILTSVVAFGQTYMQVNQMAYQQNNIQINNYGMRSVAHAMIDFTNAWEDENRKARALNRTKVQLDMLRNQYSNKTEFPEIVDGWHLVKITDNFKYCSDAKVLISDGKLKKIILNNYSGHSADFNVMTPIKNAKAVINWELPNRGTDIAEVYFVYDLNGPNLKDAPKKPGFITFWSDHRKAKTIEVWMGQSKVGELSKKINKAECFSEGGLTLELRPGRYEFKAAARGAMDWRGSFVIKEDQCLTYLMNRDNTD